MCFLPSADSRHFFGNFANKKLDPRVPDGEHLSCSTEHCLLLFTVTGAAGAARLPACAEATRAETT